MHKLNEELASLRAENDRLKSLVNQILAMVPPHGSPAHWNATTFGIARIIAESMGAHEQKASKP